MIFNEHNGRRDVKPEELATMSVDDAMSYVNGAASGLTAAETMESLKYVSLQSGLEDFIDIAAGLADYMRSAKNNGVEPSMVAENIRRSHQLSDLKDAAKEVVKRMRDVGVDFEATHEKVGEICRFVIEGSAAMLGVADLLPTGLLEGFTPGSPGKRTLLTAYES